MTTPVKSDPIDALAVARAFLREPDLPIASHDEVSRELKLLVDRREVLVAQRTATRHPTRIAADGDGGDDDVVGRAGGVGVDHRHRVAAFVDEVGEGAILA